MKPMTRVEKKDKRKKFLFTIFIILVLSIVLLQIGKRIDFFNIKYIDIKGLEHLNEEALLKNTNIKKDVNSFDILLTKEKMKLKNNPYIKDIKLSRTLPNRILVEVNEKKESFRVKNIKNVIVLDEEGTILDIRNKASDNLTLINGLKLEKNIEENAIGDSIYDYIESDQVKEFLKLNSEIELLNSFKEIDILKDNNIKIITKENKQIDFGNLRNIEYKLKLLNEMLVHVEMENIEYEKILMDKGDNPIIVREKDIEDEDSTE